MLELNEESLELCLKELNSVHGKRFINPTWVRVPKYFNKGVPMSDDIVEDDPHKVFNKICFVFGSYHEMRGCNCGMCGPSDARERIISKNGRMPKRLRRRHRFI